MEGSSVIEDLSFPISFPLPLLLPGEFNAVVSPNHLARKTARPFRNKKDNTKISICATFVSRYCYLKNIQFSILLFLLDPNCRFCLFLQPQKPLSSLIQRALGFFGEKTHSLFCLTWLFRLSPSFFRLWSTTTIEGGKNERSKQAKRRRIKDAKSAIKTPPFSSLHLSPTHKHFPLLLFFCYPGNVGPPCLPPHKPNPPDRGGGFSRLQQQKSDLRFNLWEAAVGRPRIYRKRFTPIMSYKRGKKR